MFGIDHFTTIINPPQSCILAIGLKDPKLVPALEEERSFKVVQVLLGLCKAGTDCTTHVGGSRVDIIQGVPTSSHSPNRDSDTSPE